MSFGFPTNLTNEEIQHSLSLLHIYIDIQQLTKPNYESIKPIFEQAVLALTNTNREELMQPKFSALDAFEYPELHDESIPTTNFFRLLTKLMLICGVKDFSLNDLFKPEVSRLKRNLCAIINFAKFRDEKVQMYDELEAELQAKVQHEEALKQEYEKNLAILRQLQAERASKHSEVSAIDADVQQLAVRTAQLNKTQATLHNEVKTLKQEINKVTDQSAEAKLNHNAILQEIEQLQEQIVQSPDKHRQAIADMQTKYEIQRTAYAEALSKSNDADRMLEMIAKFEREVQRCIRIEEELDEAVGRKKEVSAMVKDVRQGIATGERRHAELVAACQATQRQLAGVQDKLGRVEQQAQLKVEAAQAHVEEQLKRKEAMEAEQAASDAKLEEKEATIRKVRERMQEEVAAKDTKVRNITERYALLRRFVADYNRKMEAAMSAGLPYYDIGGDTAPVADVSGPMAGMGALKL